MPQGLPFSLQNYIELVDWTGRHLREDKRGAIQAQLPDILTRINIPSSTWLALARQFESKVSMLVGEASNIKAKAKHFGYQRTPCHGTLNALTG